MKRSFIMRSAIVIGLILCGCATPPPGTMETSQPETGEFQPIVVAVLPFSNFTEKGESDWLSIGISELLSNKLRSLPEFSVVDRTKVSESLKEIDLSQTDLTDDNTVYELGQRVGSEELVVGSYQVDGKNILIRARFFEVETAKILADVEVEGRLNQVSQLLNNLVDSSMAQMNIPLTREEKSLAAAEPVPSLRGLELFSLAMDFYTDSGRTLGLDQRIANLDQVTQIDPNFASSYIALGDIYTQRMEYDRAVSSYEKVIILQPENIGTRSQLADVYERQGNSRAYHRERKKIEDARKSAVQDPDRQGFVKDRQQKALNRDRKLDGRKPKDDSKVQGREKGVQGDQPKTRKLDGRKPKDDSKVQGREKGVQGDQPKTRKLDGRKPKDDSKVQGQEKGVQGDQPKTRKLNGRKPKDDSKVQGQEKGVQGDQPKTRKLDGRQPKDDSKVQGQEKRRQDEQRKTQELDKRRREEQQKKALEQEKRKQEEQRKLQQQKQQQQSSIRCRNCNTLNPKTAKFCSKCKKQL